MTLRGKLLCVSLLLCLALAGMFFSAAGTIRAYRQLQQNHQHIITGDVNTVSSWMTLPYVSQVYHVPESCLTHALHISNPWMIHHASLHVISDYTGRPLDTVLLKVREAILAYRKYHSACPASTPSKMEAPGFTSVLHIDLSTLWREVCL
jgi:hypothetical protein